MRSARLFVVLLLPLLTAALLAACSNTSSQGGGTATSGVIRIIPTETMAPPTAPPATNPPAAENTFENGPQFVIKSIPGKLEYDVKKITMTVGQRGTLTFVNEDQSQRHGLYIERLILIPMDPKLGIDPSTSTQVSQAKVNIQAFDTPGEYEYYCGVPGHREAGMSGILEVVAE
jgi:plastocyanin